MARVIGGVDGVVCEGPILARGIDLRNLYGARVSFGADVSEPNASVLSWNTEDFDLGGYFNPAAPTKLIVPAGLSGKYLVGAFVDIAGAPAGNIGLNINRTGLLDTLVGTTTQVGFNPLLNIAMIDNPPDLAEYTVQVFFSVSPQTVSRGARFYLVRLGS